ncbi:Myosin-1 [Balamuthia mandrillaris]
MFRLFKGEGVDDLVMCSSPSNSNLTAQLQNRFDRELIYTNLGEVLVSVNPYKYLPITGEEFIKMYQFAAGSGKAAPPPHIYGLAERMYRRLVEDNESQCVIISGESGAGKTVGAKLILNYITAVSPNGSGASSSGGGGGGYGGGGGGGGGFGGGGGGFGGDAGGGGGESSFDGGMSAGGPPPPMGGAGGPPIPGRGGRGGRGGMGGPPGAGGPGRGGGPGGRGGRGGGPPPAGGRGGRGGGPPPAGGRGGRGGARGGGFGGGAPMRSGPVDIQMVKKVIIDSNPLLEAFGNAKTVRNDNSSRFGKYLEIQFDSSAAPVGGQISTFLLEKTRVAFQGKGERNFHIFYQLCAGADSQMREELGLGTDLSYFHFLSQSGCNTVEDVDDAKDFQEVKAAMSTVGITPQEQNEIFRLLAAILWLGNINFKGNAPAQVTDSGPLDYAAYLLQVPPDILTQSLTHKYIQSGSARATQYQVPQNPDQCYAIRDALAKTIYSRVFDFLVEKINRSMSYSGDTKVIGVLDIYGFEIFEYNSFEQFCINYVNERLQQIFIELTVRGEQEEYHEEGMKWKDIKFFDNKVVCELIEGSRPPGIFRILDDVCRSVHAADQATIDAKFMDGVSKLHHEHLVAAGPTATQFTVKHYAGDVDYDVAGFPFKNKDTLFQGLVLCMQESQNPFIHMLFPEDVSDDKRAPPTAGLQIRNSANYLMERLSQCCPHYIRCIKPNDKKVAMSFNSSRVEHQVKYLGLLENVKVKRSGYAYRHFKDVFLRRYGVICTKNDQEPQPSSIPEFVQWVGGHIPEINVQEEFEEGKTKIFVKSPETIFILEEILYKRTDPEGYKLKVQEYKQREKLAQQKQGKHGLKPKCIVQ